MARASLLWLKPLTCLSLCVALTACVVSIPGKEGRTTYHVIIGFGIVSVNEPAEQAIVTTDTQALGITLSDQPGLKMGVGYSSSTVVTVADGAADIRVEVSKVPGRPLIVDTQSAMLKPFGSGRRETHEPAPP